MARGKDAPAFWCYAKQVYSESMDLSPAEFGLYWRAVCWEWNNGALPSNERRLCRILGISPAELDSWSAIAHHFRLDSDGYHSHYGDERRREREQFLKKSAAGGRASGKSRRQKSSTSKGASGRGTKHPSGTQPQSALSDSAKLAKLREERRARRKSTTYKGSESDTKERKSKGGSSGFERVGSLPFNDLPPSAKSEAEHSTCTSKYLGDMGDLGSTSVVPHTRTARAPDDEPRPEPGAPRDPPGAARSRERPMNGNGSHPTRGSPSQPRHAAHAWCSPRPGFCVPRMLHDEFRGKSGKPDAELFAWYQATLGRYDGVQVGDDTFDFWRGHFREWVGSVAPSARPDSGSDYLARRAQREARMEYGGDDWRAECRELHGGECEKRVHHELRMAKERDP